MIEERCDSCRFSRPNPFGKLECRHNIPKSTPNAIHQAYWPVVLDVDWCAKWDWDGKCDHSETEPFINGDHTINRCKRCGGRA